MLDSVFRVPNPTNVVMSAFTFSAEIRAKAPAITGSAAINAAPSTACPAARIGARQPTNITATTKTRPAHPGSFRHTFVLLSDTIPVSACISG